MRKRDLDIEIEKLQVVIIHLLTFGKPLKCVKGVGNLESEVCILLCSRV